jgi:uncharacterized Rmd1/YagE family protein
MDDDRYQFLCDRIEHVEGRVDALEAQEHHEDAQRGTRWSLVLGWLTVVLIVVEIVEAILIARHWS